MGSVDPTKPDDDPERIKQRFACLGAVGPDVMYALADFHEIGPPGHPVVTNAGPATQPLEDFVVQAAGTLNCVTTLMEEVNRVVGQEVSIQTNGLFDSLKQTFDLLLGVLKEGFLAALVDNGLNLWPQFEARRQQDKPRDTWFWADYLHYARTGKFTESLIRRAQGNQNLTAYALGYATHYVTDTVGHPYVNTIVGAPWRLFWQRHHLVENFIDAFVWDRWHHPTKNPNPPPTPTEDPLDTLRDVAQERIGDGAPLTNSRLHDHINIGTPGFSDQLDHAVETVCRQIRQGLFQLGVDAPKVHPPNDPVFVAWTHFFADTLRDVYADNHPTNLSNGGFPTADDIAGAYAVFSMILKVTTEESVTKPIPPDIVGNIHAAIEQLLHDVGNDLKQIGPPPVPSSSGAFSPESALDALEKLAKWAVDAAEHLGKAVFDFLRGLEHLDDVVEADAARFALFLLNTGLFAVYKHFRNVLVINAYSPPFTDQLQGTLASFPMTSLWTTFGPPPNYPVEELVPDERDFTHSRYNPMMPEPGARSELPRVSGASPYGGKDFDLPLFRAALAATPDSFIDAANTTEQDMFSTSAGNGPLKIIKGKEPNTFQVVFEPRNFGGAIVNCERLLSAFLGGSLGTTTVLPDYNLDGDRGYAWPCWDSAKSLGIGNKKGLDPAQNTESGFVTVALGRMP